MLLSTVAGVNAQNSVDTLQRFSNSTGDAKHHQYRSSNPSACNYGYIFGHSCYEYKAFAERYTVNDTARITGLFAYIASEDVVIGSEDSAAFTIYRDSANFPGARINQEKMAIQDLKVNSIFGVNDVRFNNFTLAGFSDSATIYPDSAFFASFAIPQYRNNNSVPEGHADTLTLRTSKDDPGINVRNLVRQRTGRWLEAEMFTEKNVYCYLAPVVDYNVANPFDTAGDDDNTGLKPLVKNGGLGIIKSYPNPAQANYNIDFSLDAATAVNIRVFSTNGTHVKSKKLGQVANGRHQVSLQVGCLEQGTYIYTLETQSGMLSGKLTKQ